jgi:hypothetical protein
MNTDTHAPATFVMPHYADRPRSAEWLDAAVAGLIAQTEPDWTLVIVDDASPDNRSRNRLQALTREHPGRVFVVFQERNRGAGACRNTGVRWAKERGSPLVLFHDADDISHPRRLEVVKLMMSLRSTVDFIYSPIVVIDECGVELPRERLIPALQEILEAHDRAPLEGTDAWIRMGTELGYTCVTSTVAARTELATAHPFPSVRFSEDQHTWLRMSAGGTGVAFAERVPTRYRVPQDIRGQSSRHRLGETCDGIKARVDTAGFGEAMALAIRRGQVRAEHERLLWERFFLRLAQTMRRAGRDDLADELVGRAIGARAL